VVNPVWRFRWGFCGSFTNDVPATVPVDAATGVHRPARPVDRRHLRRPDRVEGSLTAPDRQTPGYPETHATFLAEPGAAPPNRCRSSSSPASSPATSTSSRPWMQLTRSGSLQLYDLEWRNFGEPVAGPRAAPSCATVAAATATAK
jgi:hypothetical protein